MSLSARSLTPAEALAPRVYVVLVTDVPASCSCRTMPLGYPNSGRLGCDYAANEVQRRIVQ